MTFVLYNEPCDCGERRAGDNGKYTGFETEPSNLKA